MVKKNYKKGWKLVKSTFPITYEHKSGKFTVRIFDFRDNDDEGYSIEGYSKKLRGTYGYTSSSREYIANYAPDILWHREVKYLESAEKVAERYMEKYSKMFFAHQRLNRNLVAQTPWMRVK